MAATKERLRFYETVKLCLPVFFIFDIFLVAFYLDSLTVVSAVN